MEFGKKVYAGNFVMVKRSRSLSKRDMKRLREEEGFGDEVAGMLTRGSVPYIRVESVGGSWAVEYGVEQTMFYALDEVTVAQDGRGDWRVVGDEGENVKAMLAMMLADTTVVGDAEFQAAKLTAMVGLLKRMGGEVEEDGENGD